MNKLSQNMNVVILLKNPIVLSGLIHAILLLILALVTLHPTEPIRWHSFDWEQNYTTEIPEKRGDRLPDTSGNTRPDTSPEQVGQIPIPSQDHFAEETSSPVAIANPIEARSELIETPSFSKQVKTPASSSLPRDQRAVSYLRDVPYGSKTGKGSGNDGFGTDFDGEGVNIVSRIAPNVEATIYGTVTMEFRLNSDGNVVSESITVRSYTASEYIRASVNALEKWKFSFVGRYDRNRIYRITFIFNPT
ncbi:MAG: hypothetical protein U1C33_04125 [Candidatus Cloacimonadaceae bacterium]|nr:hypothetical protein [Candidatus Cloacimonadaceae bacterium]